MKIIVIGCPGSGKSTFSKKLNKVLNIPLFHLDMLYHNADGTHISKEELEEKLDDELRQVILNFSKEKLPQIYDLLGKYKDDKNIVTFKSREEAEKYILKCSM